MIKILAKGSLKPGFWEKAAPLYKELIENTHQEEGCLEYVLYVETEDENKYCMVETWASEEALAAHMQSAHFTRIIPQLRAFSGGPSEMSKLKVYPL